MADYEGLEKLVAKIQQELAPQASVLHNVKLPGRNSKRSRQIDVLVKDRVGQYDIMIVIDCKDYKHPVDVKGVEEFYGLLDDVGAQKGVLVCPKGFTAAAKQRAAGYQIELYSPVDTDLHKWQVQVSIPALCDFRSVSISFGFRISAPIPFQMRQDFYQSLQVCDVDGSELGTCTEQAAKRWNEQSFPTEVGQHPRLPLFDRDTVYVDNGYGAKAPIDLSVSLRVTSALYFGQVPVPQISGFRDEFSGRVITNAFMIDLIAPEDVERNWLKIGDVKEAPIKPVITLIGSVAW